MTPRATTIPLLTAILALTAAGCRIEQHCYANRDCPEPQVCEVATGACVWECEADGDCGGFGFACADHECVFECGDGELACVDGMVSICGAFCIDSHEASRPDATDIGAGIDESLATSRPGVMPWQSELLIPAEADAACQAADKRLCTPAEWEAVCAGPDGTAYTYGDEYDPTVCNAVDTHCDPDCGIYPDCYRECDSDYHVMATGSFDGCTNAFGVFDLSGNVWEAVLLDDGADHFRGGAYDCGDPGLAHQCGYDGVAAGSFPNARGFRCCADGEPAP